MTGPETAMCDSEGVVAPAIRAVIRRHLKEERAALMRRSGTTRPARDPASAAADDSARQSLDLERDVDAAMDERAREALDEVLEALERLDEGTFGICVDCERPIGEGRLLALPHACRCLDCQATAENARS